MRTRGRASLPEPVVEVAAEDTKNAGAAVKVRPRKYLVDRLP